MFMMLGHSLQLPLWTVRWLLLLSPVAAAAILFGLNPRPLPSPASSDENQSGASAAIGSKPYEAMAPAESSIGIAPLILIILTVGPPLTFGIVFGPRLWVQHYAPTVPLLYVLVAASIEHVASVLPSKWTQATILGMLAALTAINAIGFGVATAQLVTTGGHGLSSDAIDRFAKSAIGDRQTTYILPDWGLFMQFAMITRGKVPIWTNFDSDLARKRICSGNSVVVASIGNDAKERESQRVANIGLSPSNRYILSSKDGEPVVYVDEYKIAASKCLSASPGN